MMFILFGGMLTAYLLGWYRFYHTAVGLFTLTLLGALAWFLFDVYSPSYGFAMPWLRG